MISMLDYKGKDPLIRDVCSYCANNGVNLTRIQKQTILDFRKSEFFPFKSLTFDQESTDSVHNDGNSLALIFRDSTARYELLFGEDGIDYHFFEIPNSVGNEQLADFQMADCDDLNMKFSCVKNYEGAFGKFEYSLSFATDEKDIVKINKIIGTGSWYRISVYHTDDSGQINGAPYLEKVASPHYDGIYDESDQLICNFDCIITETHLNIMYHLGNIGILCAKEVREMTPNKYMRRARQRRAG